MSADRSFERIFKELEKREHKVVVVAVEDDTKVALMSTAILLEDERRNGRTVIVQIALVSYYDELGDGVSYYM